MLKGSESTATLPPAPTVSPARKPPWLLIGLIAFVVIVAAAWFIFDMNNPPFNPQDKEKKELLKPGEDLQKRQEEDLRKQQDEALRKQQEEDLRKQQDEDLQKQQDEALRKQQEEDLQKQQDEALRKQQDEDLRKQQEEDLRKQQDEDLRKQQEEEQRKRREEEIRKQRQEQNNKTMPPSRLSALRGELKQCEDFRCTKRAQQKYCEGYWNRVAECKSAL